jgi:RNase P/RNase MRP subunit POP5
MLSTGLIMSKETCIGVKRLNLDGVLVRTLGVSGTI